MGVSIDILIHILLFIVQTRYSTSRYLKREDSILLGAIGSIGILAILVSIFIFLPPATPVLVRPDIPDSVFLDKAADLSEVKLFLERYSNAEIRVLRGTSQSHYGGGSSEYIFVYYWITRFAATGERWNATEIGRDEPSASLGVWFDPEDLTVMETRFYCSTEKSVSIRIEISNDIIEYLKTATGYCWEDRNPPAES